jgi:hypothetical protein
MVILVMAGYPYTGGAVDHNQKIAAHIGAAQRTINSTLNEGSSPNM